MVWPLVAFGGTHPSTAIPFSLICVFAALAVRPKLDRGLDGALVAFLVCIAVQLVPLPSRLTNVLSPHAQTVNAALALAPRRADVRPLTINPSETAWALLVTAAAIALFWIARARFRTGGVRRLVRVIAGVGLAVSLLAIAQAATAGRYIYWLFRTEFEGPLPFGPFINRNHFATWVIMAAPVCFGYLAARAGRPVARPNHLNSRTRLARAIDGRSAWLWVAATVMLLALLLSLSRSGALALGTAAIITLFAARRRLDRRQRGLLLGATAVAFVVAMLWADIPAIAERLGGARTGFANRFLIWRETLPVMRDFWLTGTGAGTYGTAMLLYQQSDRTVYFNQAHNHYLQVATEGGLLLLVPAAIVIAIFVRTAADALKRDDSPKVWIRIGAACGLLAAALQAVWETGLVMPANAALAATLAAVLVHEREGGELRG